ncbi:MAG TPA: hypothetical protein VHK25_09280, partial [Acidimicrobiales bacterium]|nr:hypothetical protein [Acidimicrobiales bacterium]
MPFAAPPPGLGRGVVVNVGDPVAEPWGGAPVVTVDEAALVDPGGGVVAALHDAWAERRPVVVALGVDPARFREPASVEVDEPWRLTPELEVWSDRLHFLVWANTYDARDGEPVWWWARKAVRLGAAAAGGRHAGAHGAAGDVVLPDGTRAWVDGGPRGDDLGTALGGAVVHAESVEQGLL